jgi:hypothetical protein
VLRAQTGRVFADWSAVASVVPGVAAVVVVFTAARWYARRRAGASDS